MQYHYTGYGHVYPSFYDYKLEFGPFEWLEIGKTNWNSYDLPYYTCGTRRMR